MTAAGILILAILIAAGWAVVVQRAARRPAESLPPRVPWPVTVSTLAGGGVPGFAEGADLSARYSDPFGVAIDPAGQTYVSDAGDNNVIHRIDGNGIDRVLAGGGEGFRDGRGLEAAFNTPSGIAMDTAGTLYVADTGNHALRKVTQDGVVSTIAGDGTAGRIDGAGARARFDGPLDVAVARDGTIFVADAYNDCVRQIARDGTVSTIAGGAATGYRDGPSAQALFDTPSGIAIGREGDLLVADTGNDVVRRITRGGEVTTLAILPPVENEEGARGRLVRPVGVSAVESGDVYVTDGWGRVIVFSADGHTRTIAGSTPGFANGDGRRARFNNPTGIAADRRGIVRVADSDNYLVRQLTPHDLRPPARDVDLSPVPLLTAATLGLPALRWPFDPQDRPHEIAATFGEARGSLGGDGRERLHSGIDVRAAVGTIVRAVRSEKVQRPLAAVAFADPNELMRIGVVSYVHIRVGRGRHDDILDADRFSILIDEDGRPIRMRVRRGTRFDAGEAIGTVNRFAHVHLDIGPRGAEINPLSLPLIGFRDRIPPTIVPRGISVLDETGAPVRPRDGRLTITGRVSIVVDAYDRIDGNLPRRRLGVYCAGFQVLRSDGVPAPGFDEPRFGIRLDRQSGIAQAGEVVYAAGSGITVYGNKATSFRYVVTNTLDNGHAERGWWDASSVAPGEYVLRVIVADYAGNTTRRDVAMTVLP